MEHLQYKDSYKEYYKEYYKECTLCPRMCHADRFEKSGFCNAGSEIKLAHTMLHRWEEPSICGEGGSGAVFFSYCPLGCIFCQNYDISAAGSGRDISVEELCAEMLKLRDQGAENIDLITGTHYIPSIIEALDRVKPELGIPVVWNSGGYERVESIRMLEGYIDVYLPDIKYKNAELAADYSRAPDYYETAMAAVKEMIRQTGAPQFDERGVMKRGTILRHLVLPGCRKDSIELMECIKKELPEGQFLISLMSQFTPYRKLERFKNLNRRITSFEYDSVVKAAVELGLDGYMQERTSADECYIPEFSRGKDA